jgi:hypothetical protein
MMDTTTVEPGTQNFSTSIQVTYSIKWSLKTYLITSSSIQVLVKN